MLNEDVDPGLATTLSFRSGTAERPLGPGKLLSHFQIVLSQMACYHLLSNQFTIHSMRIALSRHKYY